MLLCGIFKIMPRECVGTVYIYICSCIFGPVEGAVCSFMCFLCQLIVTGSDVGYPDVVFLPAP